MQKEMSTDARYPEVRYTTIDMYLHICIYIYRSMYLNVST